MRIVLNHVTRMTAPRICIAGIDEESGRHVRPTTGSREPLMRALLREQGGPLSLGALVDLGSAIPRPNPPEVEDHACAPDAIEVVRRLDGEEYLQLLQQVGDDELEALFGPELERRKWTYAVEEGRGRASLGVVRPRRPPALEIDEMYGKLKLRLDGLAGAPAYLAVTDIRFVEQDHQTIRADRVEDVRRRLRRGVDAFLMLGLTRPWCAAGDDRARHWLQVNGVCLADRPLGEAP